MSEKRTIDFMALTRGLLQDLRDAYSARPPRGVKRTESSGITQIEQVAARLRADYETGLDPVAAMYRERAEGAAATLTQRNKRITAYAKRERRAVTADPKKFIVAGRVLDASTGVGLPNVIVNAFDAERKHDETLDSTHTDAFGYCRVECEAADLEKLGERPRVLIEVLDDGGTAIFTSEKAFAQKVGSTEFLSVKVDGSRVAASRDLGKRIDQSVSGWIESTERKIRVSGPRGDLPLRQLRGRPEVVPGPVVPRSRPKPKSRRPVTLSTGSTALEDVKGIGREFASRLAAAGVTTIGDVAKMKPETLATILNTSVSRARGIVVEARRVANRPKTARS